MTKRTYMITDVAILTALACLLEAVNILLIRSYFSSALFSLSIVVPMSVLVMMRWKWAGGITAALSGVVYCLCLGAEPVQYLIYAGGNLFVLCNLAWFLLLPRKKISKNIFFSLLFVLTAWLLVITGRTVIAAIAGNSFVEVFAEFAVVEALNLAMALVLILVARRQKTLFVSQTDYLNELAEEKQKEAADAQEEHYRV